jgi:hypothetical protein
MVYLDRPGERDSRAEMLFGKNYRERLYKLGIDFLQEPRREQVARGKEDLPRVIDRDRWILPVSGPADEVAGGKCFHRR